MSGTPEGNLKTAASRLGVPLEEYRRRQAAGEKWCTGCKDWHSVDLFGRDKTTGDGFSSVCRRGRERWDPRGPAQRIRREMAAKGLVWCRDCGTWRPVAVMTGRGLCRDHANARYRAYYARNGTAIRQRIYARKRSLRPLTLEIVEILRDRFGNDCVYCGRFAETWDHVRAVARGGKTEPGNIVPACIRCNSSKGAKSLMEWEPPNPSFVLLDVLGVAPGNAW